MENRIRNKILDKIELIYDKLFIKEVCHIPESDPSEQLKNYQSDIDVRKVGAEGKADRHHVWAELDVSIDLLSWVISFKNMLSM
jgi:hypothetical protein